MFFDALGLEILDKQLLILGDFNCPHFNSFSVNDRKTRILTNFMFMLSLIQYNNILNCNDRALDLVFSNLTCNVAVSRDMVPLVPEDIYHPALIIDLDITHLKLGNNFSSNKNLRYNFSNADFMSLYDSFLHVDWSFLSTFINVGDTVSAFYNQLFGVIDLSVPIHRSSRRSYPPWFNSDIKRNLKLKFFYYKKWKATKSSTYYNQFSRLRSLIKTQIKFAYNEYHRAVERNI